MADSASAPHKELFSPSQDPEMQLERIFKAKMSEERFRRNEDCSISLSSRNRSGRRQNRLLKTKTAQKAPE